MANPRMLMAIIMMSTQETKDTTRDDTRSQNVKGIWSWNEDSTRNDFTNKLITEHQGYDFRPEKELNNEAKDRESNTFTNKLAE